MKQLLLLIAMIFSLGMTAQDLQTANSKSTFKNVLGKISVTAAAGTPAFGADELKNLNFNKLSQVSLSELNIAYKVNNRFSFGISSMSNLSNVNSGYYNAENQFSSLCNEEDDNDINDGDDDNDMNDDDDDNDMNDGDDDGCDDDDFGQNLMGVATFKLSDNLPFFIRAAGGYSFSGNAPAYSAMIGYNQKLFAGFGIMAGIRFSDILYKKPAAAVRLTNSAGLKGEVGLSWNF